MNKTLKNILIGFTVITGIGIIGYLALVALVWYQFNIGCGIDDGPFKAVIVAQIEITKSAKEFDLSDNGILMLENRNDTLSPILTLIEKGKVKWTLDMNTKNTKGYESTNIWRISNISVEKKTDPIKLFFTGHWTYGAEHGSIEIDREDGDNKFCLSW
ncbi:hypothetical protein CXF68_16390 [Tenacibaculum sp. Bg11-29]|uniref:hypothetical protein n=1 Tax=Tenacibaculum sp. Bg11-29 TaxID=2058306 RepID=UPI000C34F79D|nr:hypothetical protein [Tenacibaculum sp. Bg11-29]PKH52173.1 hypothetical protein CXF68_16390 [Tenacibaculum sp. Bg11-29]